MTVKRTVLQDEDVSQITSNVKTKTISVTLHFVTAEFDYDSGKLFATQLLTHLERIAPDGQIGRKNTGQDAGLL